MQENNSPSITYREYKFASDFPFLLMQGTHISSQTDFVHFHNCVEIALLENEDVLCHYIFFNPEQLLASLHPNGFSEEFF